MPSDDNVTPLRSSTGGRPADDEAQAAAAAPPQPETFAGPGWTGQTIYPEGAPPRVAASDAPPAETMPSAAATEAREDLDDAAAELARRVHPEPVIEVADPVESPPPEPGTPVVDTATVAHEAVDPLVPESEGDPAEWRARCQSAREEVVWLRGQLEAAEDRRDIAEGAHLGLQTRNLRAEALADALEALAGTVRPLVPRLPVKQREPLYQAHGRALEVLAEYRKAGT